MTVTGGAQAQIPAPPYVRRRRLTWKRALVIAASAATALVVLGFVAVSVARYRIAQDEGLLIRVNYAAPSFIPSELIAKNLDKETGSLVYTSLSILTRREYPGAQERARELLKSRDSYTWLNAAHYLAVLDDQEAVPYLIKGLRHYAWRSYDESARQLRRLTGQKYGKDFEQWKQWWMETHPESRFDFDSNM